MFRRQLIQGAAYALGHFAALRFLEGIAELAGQALQLYFRLVAAHRRMPALAAAKINRDIGRDPVKPGRKAGPRLKFPDILERTYEGLLCQLKRILLVVHHRHRHSHHATLVTLDQDATRPGIPRPGPLDELGFVPVLAIWLNQRVRRSEE